MTLGRELRAQRLDSRLRGTEAPGESLDRGALRLVIHGHRLHFRHAALALRGALDAWPADRVILGGPDEAVAAVSGDLPVEIAAKVIGRINVRVAAPLVEVTASARELDTLAKRERERDSIERLRQRAAQGRQAVVGLEATLTALADQRVATLFVRPGFAAVGARCPACGHLGVDVRQCPTCRTTNVEIEDVVELAMETAVAQDASVEFCDDGELQRFGSIGALARW